MKAVRHTKHQQSADLDDADRNTLRNSDLSDFMKQTGMSKEAARLNEHKTSQADPLDIPVCFMESLSQLQSGSHE